MPRKSMLLLGLLVVAFGLASADSLEELFPAAWDGDVVTVQRLVENGIDVNAAEDEVTAQNRSACQGHADIVEYLLQKGARVNRAGHLDRTALHLAAVKGRADATLVLLEAGADTEVRDVDGVTPLGLSVFGGDPQVVEHLVEHGADVHAVIPPRN